jgi:transcriptional regulator with PAS, ATPase and Fis domain
VDIGVCFIGSSATIRLLRDDVAAVAGFDAKVLISGESGVGKDLVARLLHRESRRRQAPLVTINCRAVPDSLLESELFGLDRDTVANARRHGDGLLAAAHGGTIFINEIGDMSLRLQALLLRFLETGDIHGVSRDGPARPVDVRIISATQRNLRQQIDEGAFREDLFYRLNVVHLVIPPLRERPDDIPLLIELFLHEHAQQRGGTALSVSADAKARLMAYGWPGNVRELRHVVEGMLPRLIGGTVIDVSHLPRELQRQPSRRVSRGSMTGSIRASTNRPGSLFESQS